MRTPPERTLWQSAVVSVLSFAYYFFAKPIASLLAEALDSRCEFSRVKALGYSPDEIAVYFRGKETADVASAAGLELYPPAEESR